MKCECGKECKQQEETWVQDENGKNVYYICGHGYMICHEDDLEYFKVFVETDISKKAYKEWKKAHVKRA